MKRRLLRGFTCTALGLMASGALFYAVVALNRTAVARPLDGGERSKLLRVRLTVPPEPQEEPEPKPQQQDATQRTTTRPQKTEQPVPLQLDTALPNLPGLTLDAPPKAHSAKQAKERQAPSRTRVFTAQQVDQPATPLSPVSPPYPELASKRGIEGLVVLKLLVDERGLVRRVKAVSGPPLLVQTSLDFARRIHFVPARKGGERVKQWVVLPLKFRLQ